MEGTVKNVTDFGAFIDLGGVDGLLHISEMSWGRVENPKKVFQVGEKVEVLIKDINDTKIALSLKFPETNPWANAADDFAVGKVIEGKVARMTDFGAFVELAPGVDALLHVSQISKAHVDKPSDVLSVGQVITAKIVDLNEHIPPDPVATDTNPSYTLPSLPSETQKLTANWGVWSCYWVPVWVWCDHGEDGGHWVDEGYWEYEYTGYSASISGVMSLMPDDIVPTASGKAMKSGYGVKQDVTATLSTDAPTSHITHPQTAFSVFPEFQYQTYLRLLQRVSSGRSAKFTFQPNDFSTYNRTVHFTPIWFPDSTNYTVFTQVWDTWTPDGMLSINLNDYVSINGSLYDDWYTNRE